MLKVGHYLTFMTYMHITLQNSICLKTNSAFSVQFYSGVIREIVFLLALGLRA